MKDNLFNLYLQSKAYIRRIYSSKEGNEDVVPESYKKVNYILSEDGHTWGSYHPKFPHQYWDRMFVHKEYVPLKQKSSIKGLRIIYELESSFYPRKFNDITVPYGTGVLKTIKSYKYGYFTCRIAFPNVPGQWPAFWLYNGDGDEYSEIDIVEAYSKNGSYNSHIKFQPNIHYKDKGVWINTGAKNSPLPKRANPFYKFSLLWEPDSIKIFYNGYLIKRYTDKTILDKMLDMYVIFNSAIDISSKEIGNKAMTSFSDIEIYQKKK